MALKDVFKVNRKTFLNPTAWIGYNEIKGNTRTIWSIFKNLITPAKPEFTESFEESVQRQNLSEQDLDTTKQSFFAYAMIFLFLGGCAFLASFYYLFYHKTIAGWILALCVTTFLLAQAFRYHFWYFQMKHRKLGCTFDEWRSGKVTKSEE
jgi:intracellular multiplication protein IcmV